MSIERQKIADIMASLPPEWPDDPLPQIQKAVHRSGVKVIALDDDPTGTQTVHDTPVLTEWSVESLAAELQNELPCFYILTNSRSLPLAGAQALNAEIGRNLLEAARQTGRAFTVISRSDSTLRGHFPGEVDALAQAIGIPVDVTLIVPFFLAGGRYTIHDIHYVADAEWLIPAGMTEFARDAAFGYRSSNLQEWVEEKTGGRVQAADVASISLDDIRVGGPQRVADRLLELKSGSVCIVNAASDRDVEVVAAGVVLAEAQGKYFLARTAASYVRARAGITPRALLSSAELQSSPAGDAQSTPGGLIVVGSHVPKTSAQLNNLLTRPGLQSLELSVPALLDERQREGEITRVAHQAERMLLHGQTVVIFTSRKLVSAVDAERSLQINQRVADGLIHVVSAINARPRFLLAKGGITSSDVATHGLGVKRAMVLGQLLPGVPVWRTGDESRYPGLIYVVFPGNVGGPDALIEALERLA